MQIIKLGLDLYKFSSYVFLFYFVGWFLERYFSLQIQYYFLLISSLLIIQYFYIKKKNYFIILIIFLLLGNYIGKNKNFFLNVWFQNSLEQLKSNPVGFFLLKVKWKIEGKEINIFLNRDEYFNISRDIKNLKYNERLVFSIDYMPIFTVFFNKNKELVKKQIIKSSSNAGVIHSDQENNFVFYNSQTGNSLKKIQIDDNDGSLIKKWELKGSYYFHHWGDFYENKIYIPGRRYSKLNSLKFKNYNLFNNCKNKYINEDNIYIVDYDKGEVVEEINIFEIVLNSELVKYFKDCINPIHLNDIEIIKNEKHQKYFVNANIGDFLISLRNINSVVLIDHKTKKIKWVYNNELIEQHSPQFTERGTLLIFNNKGSKIKKGQSRIDEIDIRNKTIVGVFDGFKNNFYSEKRGRIQYLNQRIFVQESQKSNMFEIVCNEKFISNKCTKKEIVIFNQDLKDIFQSFAIDFF